MNLLEQDLPWLTAEARNDPDTAQHIIEAMAERVQQLQRQSDELRAENVLLKRSGSHQAYHEQMQRLKTDLRDLRLFAERNNLNQDVVSIVSFTGHGLHIPTPAPMDQTLALETSSDEPVRDLRPLHLASATRFDPLFAITSSFRLVVVNGLSVPLSEGMDWRDARSLGALTLQRGERVEATCAITELEPPRALLVVTRQGWVRALPWPLVENLTISGQPITPPNNTDSPAWIGVCSASEGDLVMLTRNGKWTRFPISAIDAAGSIGIALDADDDVACATVLQSMDLVAYFVGADGTQLAIANAGLDAHKKPGGKPVPLTRRPAPSTLSLVPRNRGKGEGFISLACFAARKNDAVLMLSNNGDLIVETLRALPIAAKPSESQPLNVVNQRLIAATLL